MDGSKVIRARRSIRRYKQEDIPDAHVTAMLEAAMCAPSACNTRPWEFYVVREAGIKDRFVEVSPHCRHVLQAPLCIVVCAQPELQEGKCSPYWQQDCGAAIENLLLEAANLGYGTCWCGLYPSGGRWEAAQDLLGCKSIPVALVTVGVPNEAPPSRGGYDPERVHYL